MLNDASSQTVSANSDHQPTRKEEVGQALKAAAPRHPALNRVHEKLVSSSETEAAMRYDRMHHRHSRS